MPEQKYFYPNICLARKAERYSQTGIAKLIGTTQKQYSLWERGEREMPAHVLVQLSRYYRVTTDYLLGLAGNLPDEAGQFERRGIE